MRRRWTLRVKVTAAVLVPICIGIGAMGWFNGLWEVGLETDGLNLGLYHRLAKYRIPWSGMYFDRFGFSLGCGWLGGMETGTGDFMYRHWVLVIPYWFCGTVVVALTGLTVAQIRRRLRGRT
jgi:hypothetical protein